MMARSRLSVEESTNCANKTDQTNNDEWQFAAR
jgi:hypothetical protein